MRIVAGVPHRRHAWPGGVEVVDEVVVAEPDDRVAANEDGSEQGEVGWLERVEAGVVTSVAGPGRHKASSAATPSPLGGAAARASR